MITERHGVLSGCKGAARCQAGYSLIELMVAIVIALFLIGGVLIVEQGVHQSHTDNSALAQIDNEERFTLTMFNDLIRRAGYYPDPTLNNVTTALPQQTTAVNGTTLAFQTPGQSLYGVSAAGPTGSTAAGATTDSIAIRYMTAGGDGIPVCNGASNPNPVGGADLIYTNYLYVSDVGGGGGNVNHYLNCVVDTTDPTTGKDQWGTPVQLVKNVQNMQIWYGISAGTPGADDNVVEYVPSASMTTADWMNVSSVKLLLTFTNPLSAQYKEQGQKQVLLFTMVVDVMGRT